VSSLALISTIALIPARTAAIEKSGHRPIAQSAATIDHGFSFFVVINR